jgi:type VI secretion system secreted protein Hcp
MKTLSLLLLALCLCSTAQAGYDIFIKFEGGRAPETVGETQDQHYKENKFGEILSFALGVENNVSLSDPGQGRASFKELSFTKKVDTASVPLMMACVAGNLYEKVTIEFRTPGEGPGPSGVRVFLRIELGTVLVQSLNMSGSDGDDVVEEDVKLVYGSQKTTYYKQDAQGNLTEAGVFLWSVISNTPQF